jgi:NAD+ kinase
VITLGLIVHPTKPEAQSAAAKLRSLAEAKGIQIVDARESERAEMVLALGGDGTILRGAAIAHRRGIPLLGVNVGRLGFLSTVEASRLEEALDGVMNSSYGVQSRMMLETGDLDFPSDKTAKTALNEVSVEKATPARTIRVRVSIDREELVAYTADGFILATPTGSTAYSLSAGGPVLEPSLEAMILTPVSAHSPLWRSSVVIQATHTVMLEVLEGPAALSADGETLRSLQAGDRVAVRKHPDPLRLVTMEDGSAHNAESAEGGAFFRKLKTRFHL